MTCIPELRAYDDKPFREEIRVIGLALILMQYERTCRETDYQGRSWLRSHRKFGERYLKLFRDLEWDAFFPSEEDPYMVFQMLYLLQAGATDFSYPRRGQRKDDMWSGNLSRYPYMRWTKSGWALTTKVRGSYIKRFSGFTDPSEEMNAFKAILRASNFLYEETISDLPLPPNLRSGSGWKNEVDRRSWSWIDEIDEHTRRRYTRY